MGVNLSVLILAKNEEKNIEACIRSALFADEVLVIDDLSSDRTKEIAEALGAKVLQRALNGNWGEQQTFAMQNAKCDWIYCLDADERISHRLAEEISRVVAAGPVNNAAADIHDSEGNVIASGVDYSV